MALLIIANDRGEEVCTFVIPAETPWGESLEKYMTGIINALQDAIDQDERHRRESDRALD